MGIPSELPPVRSHKERLKGFLHQVDNKLESLAKGYLRFNRERLSAAESKSGGRKTITTYHRESGKILGFGLESPVTGKLYSFHS